MDFAFCSSFNDVLSSPPLSCSVSCILGSLDFSGDVIIDDDEDVADILRICTTSL